MSIFGKKEQLNNKFDYRGLMLADIVSSEYVIDGDVRKHILNGVNINIARNEILGISGRTRIELMVLTEILASMRPYYKGTAKLSKLGVQRKKRRIVDEIFYIDSANMLQGNMIVLEQLMFAIIRKDTNVLAKQREMMDLLVRLGMKSLMLRKIDDLTYNQRLIIAMLIGVLSNSEIVIVNAIDQEFEQNEIALIENIVDFTKAIDKGLVVATMQPKLIGMAFPNVAYVLDGKIVCHEAVESLCARLDKVSCIIKGNISDYGVMKCILESNVRGVCCYQSNDVLVVMNDSVNKIKVGTIYELFDRNGIDCDFIKINKGRVSNSFEELVKNYDI